jgi:hypothetical protein
MADYDSPWKEALDRYFEAFLLFFFPLAHADIDWARGYETLDKELQQLVPAAEQGRRFVDKLVRVWLKSGAEQWLLIHIEVQTWKEEEFAKRMYVYNYRVFDRYDHPVISLAILADDDATWRPSDYGYGRWGGWTGTKFLLVKLLDYAAQWQALEASPNPFAVVVLAHLKALETRKAPADRQVWKLRLAKGLYDRGMAAEDVRQLCRFIDWMMDLPPALEALFRQELDSYAEEKRMPYLTTWERYGMAKGLLEGIEECLQMKFGEEGLKLLAEIRSLEDHEKLRTVLHAIRTAATPDDLRRVWEQPAAAPTPGADG